MGDPFPLNQLLKVSHIKVLNHLRSLLQRASVAMLQHQLFRRDTLRSLIGEGGLGFFVEMGHCFGEGVSEGLSKDSELSHEKVFPLELFEGVVALKVEKIERVVVLLDLLTPSICPSLPNAKNWLGLAVSLELQCAQVPIQKARLGRGRCKVFGMAFYLLYRVLFLNRLCNCLAVFHVGLYLADDLSFGVGAVVGDFFLFDGKLEYLLFDLPEVDAFLQRLFFLIQLHICFVYGLQQRPAEGSVVLQVEMCLFVLPSVHAYVFVGGAEERNLERVGVARGFDQVPQHHPRSLRLVLLFRESAALKVHETAELGGHEGQDHVVFPERVSVEEAVHPISKQMATCCCARGNRGRARHPASS